MEIVNIFLAGSTKMEAERNLVRSYANKIQADQCAKGNDIAINITTFENFSSAITEVKAQDLYDAYIHSEADYAMFIFNNQVGEISKHEFDIAFNAFESNEKPKLYIYFKKSDNYCPEYQEIRLLLENTRNYFREYEDFSHLTMLVKDHLSEIIEPINEKIIIEKHKPKGRIKLYSNKKCSVFEGQGKLTDLLPSTPNIIELPEGVYTIMFKEYESAQTINRKIRVIKDNLRTIEISFPNTQPHSQTLFKVLNDTEPRLNRWTFIGRICIVVICGIIISTLVYNEKQRSTEPEPHISDQVMTRGGANYQNAVQAIKEKQFDVAIELLNTVIYNDPDFADPYVHLASVYIETGDYQRAKEMLDIALKLNPNSNWAKRLQNRIN